MEKQLDLYNDSSNNATKIFEHSMFGRIRTINIDNEPYFVAIDVAKALGYTNPHKALKDHCDDLTKCDLIDSMGRKQVANIIPESDLYKLIMSSKQERARKFRDWVTKEVLPQIRKTGMYAKKTNDEEEIALQFVELSNKYLKTVRDKKRLEAENKVMTEVIVKQQPKIDRYDKFMNSKGYTDIRKVAKIINERLEGKPMGQNNLFQFLKEKKLLISSYEPYQKYINQKLFVLKTGTYKDSKGKEFPYSRVFVTPKGIEYISNLIKQYNKEGETK